LKLIIEFGPKILSAFRRKNQRQLRKLNDEVLRACALDCSKVNFNLAVFSYVLSKIVSKPRLLRREYSARLQAIEKTLERLLRRARGGNVKEITEIFASLERDIIALEKEDPRFLLDLVSKGKLKMAATFYAQGMSLGVASDMTGLEKQEIMDYAGQTMMFDRLEEEVGILERMKTARRFISE
jgi:hypothetical protein